MTIRSFYDRVFEGIAGRHPRLRRCHPQWLAQQPLLLDLVPVIRQHYEVVIDVGSRDKPYASEFESTSLHVGMDVVPGADLMVDPCGLMPLRSGCADLVLCTQVLEFIADPATFFSEVSRCLRVDGRMVVSLPFIMNEQGPCGTDLHRLSRHGLVQHARAAGLKVETVACQGRVFSNIVILWQHWLISELSGSLAILRLVLLPVWLPANVLVNSVARWLDRFDRTGRFYPNVMLVARKPSNSS